MAANGYASCMFRHVNSPNHSGASTKQDFAAKCGACVPASSVVLFRTPVVLSKRDEKECNLLPL